ncbi:TetR/AcrR family transcriptional regulator [Nocardiopsis sp. HNM0947]|uniref:TetR/AcrR family transcriptional regulator n=1 Tax=Nocardiopsis coralli TaxID=2772213 RepID=A0ABR9P2V5_9ACTN|nr:TetR/AcrR family transcriptional regulator [Nocardiopsis coralli]MBE2998169.1 TetR/AcrR family transcriptional regulator [Nocardiopsis coralli]
MTENTPHDRGRQTPDPQRRSARAERAILDAASELIVEVGFARMTMEGIASRARVGKQTIYRWWPSKSAVVLDVFNHLTGEQTGEALPDTGDLAADLRTVLRATVDEFNDPTMDRIARAFTAEIQRDTELSQRISGLLVEPGSEVYKQRLRSAIDAGEVRADADLELAVELLTGPFLKRWLMRTAPLTHAYTDDLVDMVMRSLRP